MDCEWQDFRYQSSDGLMLAGRKYGWEHRKALPILCLAGLTRNSADFHEFACAIAHHERAPRRVLCLDYRGRGESEYSPDWRTYDPLIETADVIDALTVTGLHHVIVVGTSRGGLLSMALAAMRPGFLSGVVLNDVGPEIDGPGLVRIKNYVSGRGDPDTWEQAEEAIKTISARDFPDWGDAEFKRQARLIYKEVNGKLVRNYDPKLSNLLTTLDLNAPLPTYWAQFDGLAHLPLMLIRGENSDLLSERTAEKMADHHPGMVRVDVPRQGHAPDVGSADITQKIYKFIRDTELGRIAA